MVMDARSGDVLHARNADTRLHPASLTKMMTLYIAFEAIRLGEITLDTKVRISQNVADEPPSRLGLRSGQRIELRYLIRAAAVKSANDAATAIAEAISGSEAAFSRRMNRTAQALGMTRSTFKNAHGLTAPGHMSTARDMTVMGRRLFYDYPQYYNIFGRRSTNAGLRKVSNTNRRLLADYRGADGIKTGYTNAAGFNLVASAERGHERIIATVFGGRSAATRNARVAELLNMGFQRAPSRTAIRRPALPIYGTHSSRTTRLVGAVTRSPRPLPRPVQQLDSGLLLALREGVNDVVAQAIADAEKTDAPKVDVAQVVPTATAMDRLAFGRVDDNAELPASPLIPNADPVPTHPRLRNPAEAKTLDVHGRHPGALAQAQPNPGFWITALDEPEPRIVTRMSSAGPADWVVRISGFSNRDRAERALLKVAIKEMATLNGARRSVESRSGNFDAVFSGLTADRARMACARLGAQNVACDAVEPG